MSLPVPPSATPDGACTTSAQVVRASTCKLSALERLPRGACEHLTSTYLAWTAELADIDTSAATSLRDLIFRAHPRPSCLIQRRCSVQETFFQTVITCGARVRCTPHCLYMLGRELLGAQYDVGSEPAGLRNSASSCLRPAGHTRARIARRGS